MGVYAHILKNWEKHNPEKVFTDALLVAFRINAMFEYGNVKSFFSDGRLEHTSMGIIDDKVTVKEGNNKKFIFNIQGVNMDDIAVGLDKDFDYLVPGAKLCSLAYIEKVREHNTELIFHFAYEYLKLNPDEYFWFEWDHAFSWGDMQRLKDLPFDKEWCFKDPL
jgi:hypothetical protein